MHRARLAILALLVACGPDPLVGTWEDEAGSDAWVNEMTIGEDMTGDATLWLVDTGGTRWNPTFDVEAQNEGEGIYEMEFRCAVDCPDGRADFQVECEADAEVTTLHCAPDNFYEMDWVKVGEAE